MLVVDVLTASGVPFRQTRFTKPPSGSYAVYMLDLFTDGDDLGEGARVVTCDATVELYEPAPDDTSEAALESAICAAGLQFTKQARYWIQEEQVYQVVYEFTYYEKRRP